MEKSFPGGLETLMAGGGTKNRCIFSLFPGYYGMICFVSTNLPCHMDLEIISKIHLYFIKLLSQVFCLSD